MRKENFKKKVFIEIKLNLFSFILLLFFLEKFDFYFQGGIPIKK